MQPPEPCPADLDARCLLQETRFQGGNNAEAKSKADIERCLKELQRLKMQMALEKFAGAHRIVDRGMNPTFRMARM